MLESEVCCGHTHIFKAVRIKEAMQHNAFTWTVNVNTSVELGFKVLLVTSLH